MSQHCCVIFQMGLLLPLGAGFNLFLIYCWSSRGWHSRNQLCCFLLAGCRSIKVPDLRATTLGCQYWWLFWPVAFYGDSRCFENAAYLELSGLSYKPSTRSDVSVCYILPEMMRNMRKIRRAKFAEPITRTLIQKLKSVLPVLIHWWLGWPWINRWRGRFSNWGTDNLNRTVRTSSACIACRGLHTGLTGLAIYWLGGR